MLNTFRKYLARPYPLLLDKKLSAASILIISSIVTLTLLIFKPFGLHAVDNIFLFIGFGFCTFIPLFISYFVLPALFPRIYHRDKWTIRHELLGYVLALILISFLNFLFNNTIANDVLPRRSYLDFIFMTLAVGAFPILVLTTLNEKVSRYYNEKEAKKIDDQLNNVQKSKLESHNTIEIISNNKSDKPIIMEMSEFVMAQSVGNYVEINFVKNSLPIKKLMRMTLTDLQNQIGHENGVLRCHKSYIVSKSKVDRVEGNARSCMAVMDCGIKIPISRSFDRSILA